MIPKNYWVVLRAAHGTYCMYQVPKEIVDLLGIQDLLGDHSGADSSVKRTSRTLVFLERSEKSVRVISSYTSSEVYAEEIRANRVVGTAHFTKTGVFNLPDAVEEHLGLTIRPKGVKGILGTKEYVAWMLPQEEFDAYGEAEDRGKPYGVGAGIDVHVYLAMSSFPVLRPVDQMEPTTVPKRASNLTAVGRIYAPRRVRT